MQSWSATTSASTWPSSTPRSRRRGDAEITNPVVDTLPLARRLIRDEVPDCRLGTLASRFRLDHRPSHRALDDALATTDLLHFLLERAAGLGVLGLDDLIALPRIGAHPQAAKLKMTSGLPRGPGVYLFRGAHDTVLYVGKATNLRQRVRSYFGSDDRRKIGTLLREAQRVTYITTPNVLAAEVLELRYIQQLAPRYNKVATAPQKYRYVRLSTDEPWPRLSVVNDATGPGVYLGPLPSKANGDAVVEALQSVFALRRCTTRIGRTFQPQLDAVTCTPAQLGVAMCPCAGLADANQYAMVVANVVQAMTTSPQLVITALQARLASLSASRRYEEAALVRDRAMAFSNAVRRQRLTDRLREAGDVGLQIGETTVHIRDGVLVGTAQEGQLEVGLPLPAPEIPTFAALLPRHVVDEVLCLARAFERMANRVTVVWCDGRWQWPIDPVPEVVGRATTAGTRRGGCLVVFDHGAAVIDAQHLGMTIHRHLRSQFVGIVERHTSPRPSDPTPTTRSTTPPHRVRPARQPSMARRMPGGDPDGGGPEWRCAMPRYRRQPMRQPATRPCRC